MTRAVQERADFAWATADNPRGEPLARIFADMREGIVAPDKINFIDDRRHAISLALDAAQPGDCLLIAARAMNRIRNLPTRSSRSTTGRWSGNSSG